MHNRSRRRTSSSRTTKRAVMAASGFAAAAMAAWLAAVTPALAQTDPAADYPNRPVRIVIGFAAGGGTDAVARITAQKLQDALGGSFLVENKTGASGRLAPDTVAHSPPDGYTLLGAAPGAMTVGTAIWDKMPYDIFKDFIPISLISDYPLVVVVSKDHPAKTVAELAAWLKANPGRANYPTPSPTFTLPIEYFKIKTGAPGTPIPYRSSNESVTSVLGGQTAFAFVETPVGIPQIESGNVRALAVTSVARTPELPNVPTLAEAGVPNVIGGSWLGILAPAGTPMPIVRKLEAAMEKMAQTEDFKSRMKAMSSSSLGTSADVFAKRMHDEVTLWTTVAKSINMKFEQ